MTWAGFRSSRRESTGAVALDESVEQQRNSGNLEEAAAGRHFKPVAFTCACFALFQPTVPVFAPLYDLQLRSSVGDFNEWYGLWRSRYYPGSARLASWRALSFRTTGTCLAG